MSTDTPLCTFVPRGQTTQCGAPQGSHRHSYRPLGRFGMGLMSHPFVPPIERTLDDAVKDMHARWARQYDEFIATGEGPVPAGSVVNLDTGETFGMPSAEAVQEIADEWAAKTFPSTPLLCTFRLAGGPCGLDSFATVHRAHTDHPGFCGVYTCHEFRPGRPEAEIDVRGTIIGKDILRAANELRADARTPTGLKMSSDIKAEFVSRYAATGCESTWDSIYGLPITVVPGRGICRIVYSNCSEDDGR